MGNYKDLFRNRGFQPFVWSQFLGALNDNLYKMAVSLFAVNAALHADQSSTYASLAQAVFILPFFLFSGYAGHLADVLSKRKVLIATSAFEIVAMSLAVVAFAWQSFPAMLAVLFLMALQSTFFSPAKYGIIPEMLPERELSRGNGLLSMTTFLAIILGTSIGGLLFSAFGSALWHLGLILVAVAVAGLLTSLGITRVPPSGARKPFRLNPWAEVREGLRRVHSDRPLWLCILGVSYFWFLGAALQISILLFGKDVLGAGDLGTSLLLTGLAAGIGVGSLIAGRWSGDKVELGLVPLGAVGMGVACLLISVVTTFGQAIAAMALLGLSGGFFIVPLQSFLQARSPERERGRIFAANNFLNTGGMLLAAMLCWALHDWAGLGAARAIAIFGVLTLVSTLYVLKTLPEYLARFVLWLLTHTLYRIRIVGRENIPSRGPALLVANHLSYVDGFLIGACMQRFIRFLMWRPFYETRGLNWMARRMHAIPVDPGSRAGVLESLERARQELRNGHVVCIFPEGEISRTGNLLPFKRGLEKIVAGLDVPIIPVYLDGVWGSLFSFDQRRSFWKRARGVPNRVTVLFGSPLASCTKAHEVRQAVVELSADAAGHRRRPGDLLHLRFARAAKRNWRTFAMADSSGKQLTYGQALTGSLILARKIRARSQSEEMIGLLLPASVGGALANIAALLAGRIPVNLNFTAGREAMQSAVGQCSIRTILTSRVFLKKAGLPELDGMAYLEDLLRPVSPFEKAWTAAAAFVLPAPALTRAFGSAADPHSPATVIFSSGSTGQPKGVLLSHHNVLSNLEAMRQIFSLQRNDCFVGVLPFFHSFGFTVTLWFPMISGVGACYHANPLDAKTVGEMAARYRATLLMATPTFYSAYLRKCTAEQFATLRLALVGAEKLRGPLAREFRDKYGIELMEGYGATEMAPVIAVNRPDAVDGRIRQTGRKEGSVGHPLPGVATKVVDPETGEALQPGREGLLLVKGPNQMAGYLGQPDKTAEATRDGWYVTGDIAKIDEDGFLTITDRLARFSKIGGEMVPHIRVEELVSEALNGAPCAVTAVPDDRKGEQLVVFHTSVKVSPEELWRSLAASELPKLWIPRRENLRYIDDIPTLGSGKVDLKRLRDLGRPAGCALRKEQEGAV
jgi:acyl-[acyl-carrier-protein]-phospholipid O-acyltransferase/long-chain-fatty-acid--[acyl-carrier-protein] ligase